MRLPEQRYGEKLVKMLERNNGQVIKHFDDYLEGVTFVLLVAMLRDLEKNERNEIGCH